MIYSKTIVPNIRFGEHKTVCLCVFVCAFASAASWRDIFQELKLFVNMQKTLKMIIKSILASNWII